MSAPRVPGPFRSLARAARRAGWTITSTGSGHTRWRSPSGQVVIVAATPGRWRSIRNTRADLKRAGLSQPPEGAP